MARIIHENMREAFTNRTDLNKQNTKVEHVGFDVCGFEPRTNVYLHGHLIAQIFENYVRISHCGYVTRTTIDRLCVVLQFYTDGSCFISSDKMFVRVPHPLETIDNMYYELNDDENASIKVPRRGLNSIHGSLPEH